MFFCRHRDSVAQAFRSDVTYMPGRLDGTGGDASDIFNPLTHSTQWSRRFIGLKLFMTLAQFGNAGYAEMLEHQTRMGNVLRKSLQDTGWRIVNSTPLPIVCFTRDGLVPANLSAELRQRQIAWMSEVQIHGIPAMRASITSFRTTDRHIEWVVSEMNALISSAGSRETVSHAH
jgi:glutamate/tyrosine decarboxylase-like PLP-dependent enzyme